ncbi:HNH endonuclease [Corynebacterium macginleyi]|uniref:HNH endonuclease signature motif containing protein n=1 Tax=Corynebacterium macginleyi TaxID=38290 RepID=UPI00190CD306|nr:HNH endonuclease signature motif containing protein [Corynebacterium macginleyi]MBK4157873.1 HNH endonuclease [Corynebacterium macginleyi]MBK4180365.1 HNH endonuclease [Corynebacterium macginleyi]MBK4182945.1 HNH endonuclease [Corynebacterium macginleyi]
MSALQAYATHISSAMDILAEAHGMPESALIELGLPDVEARDLLALAEVYFGATSFTHKQRLAAAGARHHDLITLKLIEHYAARAATQRAAWNLRVELCRLHGPASEIARRAKNRLREWRPRRRTPREGIQLLRRPEGPWTMRITAPSSFLADLDSALDPENPLDSFRELLRGEGAPTIQTTTNVIIPLNALDQILDGDGDEVTLRLTNGSTITGAQLVERTFSEHGLATLIHPVKGPVNLYRTSRFASEKQRLMAAAENPTCPWPPCNHPADKSQIHHLQAWKHGGMTNADNLTVCCPYHNGVNQDDPNAPPLRGRLARVNGKVHWVR